MSWNEMEIWADEDIQKNTLGKKLMKQLPIDLKDFKIVIEKLTISNSILWKQISSSDSFFPYFMIYFSGEDFVDLIDSQNLSRFVTGAQELHPDKKMFILVEGLAKYFEKKEKVAYQNALSSSSASNADLEQTTQNKKMSMEKIDNYILNLEIFYKCEVFQTKNTEESIRLILDLSKSIISPNTNKKISRMDFSSTKIQVKKSILAESNDKKKAIWKLQLMQIPKVSEQAANLVVKQYPTLISFMKAAIAAQQQQNTQNDISVILFPNNNNCTADRRIHESIVKRIYNYFVSTNPDQLVDQ